MAVTDKSRSRLPTLILTVVRPRHFEIEDAYSEALLALISTAVARSDHYAVARVLLPSHINHDVCDRRIAFNCIGASPEQQIARLEVIELKRVLLLTHHRLEFAGPSQPDVLLAGIAGHIFNAVLFENEIDKARAVHPTVGRIGRAVFVIEIAGRQLQSGKEESLHVGRIAFKCADRFGRQGGVRRAAFWLFRSCR